MCKYPVGFCPRQCWGGPWDPARLPGLPRPSRASRTSASVLLSQQTDETRNLGTAGFASKSGLQQPLKGRESTLCP